MADDLRTNLSSYKLQLQQVEAALTTDPENEDLLKLKKDLQEVIDLTSDLVKAQEPVSVPETSEGHSFQGDESNVPERQWAVGDKCLAPFSEDSQYYLAAIDEVLEDGTCTVTFQDYGNTDVTQVSLLRPANESSKQGGAEDDSMSQRPKTKKDLMVQQREYKKKKAEKKRLRQKQLEEERETEKNKWLSFNAKTFAKTNKGRVKKSIFATPETTSGRVGVGTCGVSGRPMTKYVHQEKWKK